MEPAFSFAIWFRSTHLAWRRDSLTGKNTAVHTTVIRWLGNFIYAQYSIIIEPTLQCRPGHCHNEIL